MRPPSLARRGVAQPGSASALGAEGRRFESCRPDHSVHEILLRAKFSVAKAAFVTSSVNDKFEEAVFLHRQGKLADAERIFAEILVKKPDHYDALLILGQIAFQTRR